MSFREIPRQFSLTIARWLAHVHDARATAENYTTPGDVTSRGQVPGGGVTADPSCQALSAMKVSATNLALCIRKDAATSGRTSSPAAIRDTCDFDGA